MVAAGLAAAACAGGATERQASGVEELERQLGAPFSPAAKPLVGDALKAVADAAAARKKHPLPENSEPCTRYVPSASEKR